MGAFSAVMPPRQEIRRRLGLAPDAPLLLVSGGGVGVASLGSTVEALLGDGSDFSVALVCGGNEALRARAEALVARFGDRGRDRCAVFGFTDRMHELMHAADLSVGKPGGLTSSESLAMGLPMAILNPVPGQEERNSDHLLEWGVAIRLNSPESLRWRIAGLLADPRRLRAMREAALARARPFAADTVADSLRRLRLGENDGPAPLAFTPERARASRAGRATTPRAKR